MGLDGTMLYTLPGSTEIYSERTQTRTFENHANLLTWQTDRSSPRRMAFKALHVLNGKAALSYSIGFAHVFFALILRKYCQNGLLLIHSYVHCRLSINYACGHVDDPPTLN